ncbi:MAG TPA: hemolysin III family protein [Candidatus Saccharimonadia bacterium]|nr:hemolysin III family protein [Candidatus Saccharimonadia bacterium]
MLPPADGSIRHFTPGEEIANWVTHGIGLLLSTAALALLMVDSILHGTAWHMVSFAIYGTTLVALYASSTIYHALRGPQLKMLFKKLDHAAIFLLIAGTYTPFLLTNLRGPLGWTLFGVIWTLCVSGAVMQVVPRKVHRFASIFAYLFAGWLVLVAIKPLVAALPSGGTWLLVAGGVCYTSGIIFYRWHKLRYHHAIWHTFVMAGSICHFLAVLIYVLPSPAITPVLDPAPVHSTPSQSVTG